MYEIYFKPITYKARFENYVFKLYVNSYTVIRLLHLEVFKDHRKLLKNTVECKYMEYCGYQSYNRMFSTSKVAVVQIFFSLGVVIWASSAC